MSKAKYCVVKKSNFKFLYKTKDGKLKWKDKDFYFNSCPEFTKSELSEVKGGAFFKEEKHYCKWRDYSFNCWIRGCELEEWVNPSVILISVDSVENYECD